MCVSSLCCILVILQLFYFAFEAENNEHIKVAGEWNDLEIDSKRPFRRSTDRKDDDDRSSDSEEDFNVPSHGNRPTVFASNITGSFMNKRTFACPRVKPMLHTGDSTADLSPEDIDIIAAMGDSLATGRGLDSSMDMIEFRGAAFPIGGDATIDGLVTLPNILLEFNGELQGVSHGMGTRDRLPDNQLNCAEAGAKSTDMPSQAKELVRRLLKYYSTGRLNKMWLMVIITIGTDEFCNSCSLPDYNALQKSLQHIRRKIPKVFVVLLGPVHVCRSSRLTINLLRDRCECLRPLNKSAMKEIHRGWASVFRKLEAEFNPSGQMTTTFGLLAIPSLTVTSRDPESLFIAQTPFLNRKGHAYAAKWLWNRLLAGSEYNISKTALSEDAYYCPSVGCPYFRTVANREKCYMLTEEEARKSTTTTTPAGKSPRREALQQHLVLATVVIVVSAVLSVAFFGTIFYRHGLRTSQSRFEAVPGV